MIGFNSPTILSLANSYEQERKFIGQLLEALRKTGKYDRIVEPCCGVFGMLGYHLAAGWKPEQIETSDIMLFSTVLGYAIMGKPLSDLEIKLDGQPFPLTGDPAEDAVNVIVEQAILRQERNAKDAWNGEWVRTMRENRSKHVERVRKYVAEMVKRYHGIKYEPLDLFVHSARVADDPRTVVLMVPPHFRKGFENFYDTGGRLTWNEPTYNIFDPNTGYRDFMEATSEWKALVICEEFRAPGQYAGWPVYCRYIKPNYCCFICTNRPEEVIPLLPSGRPVLVRGTEEAQFIVPYRIIAPEAEIRPDSRIQVVPIGDNEALYYRSLWVHKGKGGRATRNLAVLIDGCLAGIFGYAYETIRRTGPEHESYGSLALFYAGGPPHKLRLGRLATMISLSRGIIRSFVTPWYAIQVQSVMTTEFSAYPEAKNLRGIMKLRSREREKDRYKLVYGAPLVDATPQEILALFLERERHWQTERAKAKAETVEVGK